MLSKIKKLFHLMNSEPQTVMVLIWNMVAPVIPDRLFLRVKYRLCVGRWPNLDNPQTFTEKIQWLKLYNRKPEYVIMADKVKAKDWVAERIGQEHIIPTLGVWERAEDVDFDALPEKFVIKCNHNSGLGMYICKDKSKMDADSVRRNLRKGLKQDYFTQNREWPYKDIPRRIIAEQFMEDYSIDTTDLTDYKWYCFNGEPRYCQVIKDRNTKETIDFFDTEWNHQEFYGLNPAARPAARPPQKPEHLKSMIEMARKLSEGMPFSRVDLYEINGTEFFGEVTFFPASGMGVFTPDEYDKVLGMMISLPGIKRGGVILKAEFEGYSVKHLEPNELYDYKFFCFKGKVEFFKIDFGRFIDHHANYYDRDQHLLPFGEADFPPNASRNLKMPVSIDKMISYAELLAGTEPFVRVDFYEVNGVPFFGELTFFPASGMGKFTSIIADGNIGRMIEIR